MSQGFFKHIEPSSNAPFLIPRCGACGLHKNCNSPKMPYTGKGRRKILIVAEAPGKTEDKQGTQLVGQSGQLLRKTLRKHGVDLDRDCWKTNSLICYPNGKTPDNKRVECCRPNLTKTIKELNPTVIILLGGIAVKSLIGSLWKEEVGAIGRWVGWQIPEQSLNAWICPTYHPAYLLRANDPALELWFSRHLKAAIELGGSPWEEIPKHSSEDIPDYLSQVECIYSPIKAAKILRKMTKEGGQFAFDYETNMIKPDSSDARIISCSVCWEGKRTIAYPWEGEAIVATRELLAGFELKICHNAKFEERWTKKEFGHGINRCWFCSMLGSHVLDNRSGITSLKFQSFVLLGQTSYDDEVSPYLKADGSNKQNRIGEVDLGTLLKYNGMDSLLTWKIAEIQMKEMGIC